MKTKLLILSIILISQLTQVQAKTSHTALEIEKLVSDTYLISDPTERLKKIKSTIKNEEDLTRRILFMKWAISYWMKLKRDEALKINWKENLESFKFLYWVDWDTIKINNAFWNKISIRMIWIDAPESSTLRFWYKECYWKESWDYLKKLIWDSEYINIELDPTQWKYGKYWRLLAYLWLDWKNLNEELIKNWYWFEYTYSKKYKYQTVFKNAQIFAEQHKIWMWNPNTCDWKRLKIKNKEVRSKSKIKSEKTIEFNSCWTKKYCTEMDSCEEAKFYLSSCGLSRLDKDKDWIPCESLCK